MIKLSIASGTHRKSPCVAGAVTVVPVPDAVVEVEVPSMRHEPLVSPDHTHQPIVFTKGVIFDNKTFEPVLEQMS